MKKIRDIGENFGSDEITIPSGNKEIIIPESKKTGSTESLGNIKKTDINITEKKEIVVQQKRTKNFDALENKKSVLELLKSTISLRKKEKNFLDYFDIFRKKIFLRIRDIGYSSVFIVFFLFTLVFAVFSKIIVEDRVNAGYEKLLLVKQGNIGFDEIRKNINNARFDFLLSDILFTPFSFIPHEKISSVKHAIKGGKKISIGLDKISSLYTKIHLYTSQKELDEIYFSQLFINIYNDILDIRELLLAGNNAYKKILWLPSESLENQKNNLVETLDDLDSYFEVFISDFRAFVGLLGHEERRRYLIVFQNADEIRPTGGFMGSMALVEMFKGQIKLFQKKDVYAIEWDLKSADYERLPAPKGLNELTDTFGLRDANYFANLKDSSQAIKFFTDQAGLEIDGIIYINQNILLKLLDITGPIYFDEIQREIRSDNFSEVMSLLVEAKVSKQGTLGTPKQILFDFIEIFLEKIAEDKAYFDYLSVLIHEAQSRDIMMWSFRPEENIFLQNMGLTGEINYGKTLDYIYPVYTSLSGNKSDRYIQRSYTHNVESTPDSCDFSVETTIKSSHNMAQNAKERIQNMVEEYNIEQDNIMQIQGNMRNRQYVRVILPKNAEISPQQNMEIVDYGARQGIEFFLETQAQESSFYNFSYILKNPECKNYDTTIYKQPGIEKFDVNIILNGREFPYFARQEDFYFSERK